MGDPRKKAWDSLQREIAQWGDDTFEKSNLKSIFKHLKKEIKELGDTGAPEEVADCVMLLMHFAHKKGISIFDECVKKFAINKKRKWGKPDKDGVVEHIREDP